MSKWLFNNLWWMMIVAAVAFMFFMFAPSWITNPNGEVKPYQYYDVERVYTKTERVESDDSPGATIVEIRHGYCPDIAMQTTKAMLDKKLTNYEMHQLKKEANRLYNLAYLATRKSDALVAAGQQPLANSVDCPKGNELFI